MESAWYNTREIIMTYYKSPINLGFYKNNINGFTYEVILCCRHGLDLDDYIVYRRKDIDSTYVLPLNEFLGAVKDKDEYEVPRFSRII